MSEAPKRRLVAIVSADVAGYSRLMGADESGTLAVMMAHRRELWIPTIERSGGRVVGGAGDSILVEYSSAVAAVECAIAIQRGMIDRNADLPDDRRMLLRIGVNIGEVIVDGEDIYGDGVNVAARMQEIADPGGIAISDIVRGQVHDKLDVAFADATFTDDGDHEVKNIAQAVRVWRWSADDRPSSSPAAGAGARPLPPPEIPSIAVLPFDNMSSEEEHRYFADGIAEDIITALSKISQMRVIARNSTFAYKGKALDLRRIAAELGVRYVLEGSVRSGGNRLRITAQLIDAGDGSHIWAERFDRTVDDLFDIQDEITKEIVTALRVKLTDGEVALVWARGTNDIEAWQLCVRAAELFMRFSSTDYLEARGLAEKALERDPSYAYAWAVLGFTHWWDGRLGYTGDLQAKFAYADECAERAMTLDDTMSWSIGLSALVAAPLNRHEEGVAIEGRCRASSRQCRRSRVSCVCPDPCRVLSRGGRSLSRRDIAQPLVSELVPQRPCPHFDVPR